MTGICRHEFVVSLLQLAHGERYTYGFLSLLLATGLIDISGQLSKTPTTCMAWLYDIACQFRPYLLNLSRRLPPDSIMRPALDTLLKMAHGVGAAHVLGHKLECQLNLSARSMLGVGTCDGEGNERVQSLFVWYVTQLKYASPLNFRRFLSCLTQHLNYVKLLGIGKALHLRRKGADSLLKLSSAEAAFICQEISTIRATVISEEVCSSFTDAARILWIWDISKPIVTLTSPHARDLEQLHAQCKILAEIIVPIFNRSLHPTTKSQALQELWETSTLRNLYFNERKRLKSTHLVAKKLQRKVKACEASIRERIAHINNLFGFDILFASSFMFTPIVYQRRMSVCLFCIARKSSHFVGTSN